MSNNIEIKTDDFASIFFKSYLQNGFGSMGKRDIDVLVFYLLLLDRKYTLPNDIYKVCRELKLTETKVRNLYQEVQLRYMQYEFDEAKKKFAEIITDATIETKGSKLIFVIRDPLLRLYFEEWVNKFSGITDTSFNKNIVTIHKDTFQKVIEGLTIVNFEDIKGMLKNDLDPLNEAEDLEGLMNLFIKEYVKSIANEAGAMSISLLKSFVICLFSGNVNL